MAVSYTTLYELILKYVKDEKLAEAIAKAVEFLDKRNEERIEKKFEEQKPVFKAELREELRDELATKKDVALLEERMNSMEERILRYVDDKFHYLDKKIDDRFYELDKKFTSEITQIKILILITLFAVIVLNPYAYEIVKAILK
jgi:hypothetical protein